MKSMKSKPMAVMILAAFCALPLHSHAGGPGKAAEEIESFGASDVVVEDVKPEEVPPVDLKPIDKPTEIADDFKPIDESGPATPIEPIADDPVPHKGKGGAPGKGGYKGKEALADGEESESRRGFRELGRGAKDIGRGAKHIVKGTGRLVRRGFRKLKEGGRACMANKECREHTNQAFTGNGGG